MLKELPRQQLVDAIRAVHAGDLRLSPSITRRLVDRQRQRAAQPEQLTARQRLSEREAKKVGVRDRVQLVIFAYDTGLAD